MMKNLQEKNEYLDQIPFRSIRAKWGDLYNDKSKVITYEDCLAKEEKKKLKASKKKKEQEVANGNKK